MKNFTIFSQNFVRHYQEFNKIKQKFRKKWEIPDALTIRLELY